MAEYTKGPWGINKYGSVGAGRHSTTPVVAEVLGLWGADAQYGDHADNANLIAAAPELLESLQELIGLAEFADADMDEDNWHPALVQARAVVAKALGEPTGG